jgi:hypothetical protein
MRFSRLTLFGGLSVLLCLAVLAAEGADDPWLGKDQQEVVTILGPPDKLKSSGDGRTLVYRLLLLGESPPLDPQLELFQLPQVGLVARAVQPAGSGQGEIRFEPTQLDEEGRKVEGGYSQHRSASISYDTKSGKVERDVEPGPDPGKAKKLTLRFVLDEGGRVRSWSVTPKKFRKRSNAQAE